MSASPRVFISATSGDLRTIRQIVKDALLTINCHPVEQTNFEPDWRTVEGMLRAKIAGCQALVHIAGMRYGAEPDPATLPPGTPRRSYTQMEYHLGCELHEERGDTGFRVYTFICPEDFPYDPGAEPESEEKQALQQAHRAALLESPRLYESSASTDDLRARILALQENVLAIEQQQAEVRQEVRRSHKTLLSTLALVLLLLLGGLAVQMWLRHGIDTVISGQTIDTARIKTHLRESSERKLAEDLVAADRAPKAEDRESLRDAAQSAHQARLGRIDDLAASFAALAGQPDASPILQEMTRILQEKRPDAIEAALAYADKKRPEILASVGAIETAQREQIRARLQPLLKAAQLQAANGHPDEAHHAYQDILRRQPDWPDALEASAWFLWDRSYRSCLFFRALSYVHQVSVPENEQRDIF